MKTQIHTEIEIDATPGRVWAVLTDPAGYPSWNPFITELTGSLHEGERVSARIVPPGGKAMTFKPIVLAVRPEAELRWLGKLLVKGLFDGEHRFEIAALPDGSTRFVQAEDFSGILVRPLMSTMARTKAGFDLMNQALKAEVEKS